MKTKFVANVFFLAFFFLFSSPYQRCHAAVGVTGVSVQTSLVYPGENFSITITIGSNSRDTPPFAVDLKLANDNGQIIPLYGVFCNQINGNSFPNISIPAGCYSPTDNWHILAAVPGETGRKSNPFSISGSPVMDFALLFGNNYISVSRSADTFGDVVDATMRDTLYLSAAVTNTGCATGRGFRISVSDGGKIINNQAVTDLNRGKKAIMLVILIHPMGGNHDIRFTLIDSNSIPVHIQEKSFPVGVAPTISKHPTSVKVTEGNGQNANFSVAAAGIPPPAYQWQHDGKDISGAISSSFTVLNPAYADQGSYSVIVSNYVGFQKSNGAVLTVSAAPARLQQATILPDGHFTMNVGASPSRPLEIEKTIDMQNWLKIGSITNSTSTGQFIDPNPAAEPFAAYRVKAR